MPDLEFSFRWQSLSVHWSGSRDAAILTPDLALGRAAEHLTRRRASVDAAEPGCIRFRPRWNAGATWLAGVMGGRVVAARSGGYTTVVVEGSLAPLLYMVMMGGVVGAVGGPGMVLLALMLVAVNYLLVHAGMRGVIAAALGPEPSQPPEHLRRELGIE
ncbi:MAG TPA: hypothetical protein VF771_21735 [Longimicrobiaceae bacterium]